MKSPMKGGLEETEGMAMGGLREEQKDSTHVCVRIDFARVWSTDH